MDKRTEIAGTYIHGHTHRSGQCKKLALFNVLNAKKKELESKNKQFGASDTRLLARAEKTVLEEFAFVLGITRDDVVPYLEEKMK